MKIVKIGKFHILDLIISGFMDFCLHVHIYFDFVNAIE